MNSSIILYLKNLRNLFKESMMRSALAERIIQNIKIYRKLIIVLSYLFLGIVVSSYLTAVNSNWALFSSYPFYLAFQLVSRIKGANPFGKDHWIEELGGNGPRVAAYLRVSTGKQAREGLSLEVQKEVLEGLRDKLKPSIIYWFVDPGMSGEDFDRRKIKKILELRERKEIDELWVTQIDRIGRECRRSLLFFLEFSEDGGIIRTPERTYSTKELADILIFAIESYGAQAENRRRAERATASKMQNFKNKKWNKPVPFGYCRDERWIRKVGDDYEPILNEIYDLFGKFHSISKVTKRINAKYGDLIGKPLTRAQVKRILTDPVYIGKPSHMGVTVADESLRYISDEIFEKCQKILKKVREKYQQRKISPLEKLVLTYDVSVLDFLRDIVEFHHRGCGGVLVRNGTRITQQGLKQMYLCKKCGCQIGVPTKSMLKKITAEYDASSSKSTNLQEKQAVEKSAKKKEEQQTSLDAYF